MSKTAHRDDWLGFFKDPPDMVAAITLAMTVVHIAMGFAPLGVVRRVWRLFELSPIRAAQAIERGDYLGGVVRPFVGHIFFHINLAHLLLNLVAIGVLGAFVYREMENRVAQASVGGALGQGRGGKSDTPVAFAAFFLLSGMFAGLFYVLANAQSGQSLIGASGAAAGLFGGCMWIFFMRPRDCRHDGAPDKRRAVLLLTATSVMLIGLTIFLDTSKLSLLLFRSASAWQAHIGGYLFGLLTYPLFERLAAQGR